MTSYNWNSTSGGDWSAKTDWTPSGVPGSTDNVTIGIGGSYTVTVSSAEQASSLTITDGGATLAVDASLTVGSLRG